MPCGFCGRSTSLDDRGCDVTLRTVGGVVHIESNCPHAEDFTYSSALKGSKTTPCTNVPILCPLCPAPRNPRDNSPAIWKYNVPQHIQTNHTGHTLENIPLKTSAHYAITREEYVRLKIPQEQIPSHAPGNPNAIIPPPPQPSSLKRKSDALQVSNTSTSTASNLQITQADAVQSPAVELAQEPPAKRTRSRRK